MPCPKNMHIARNSSGDNVCINFLEHKLEDIAKMRFRCIFCERELRIRKTSTGKLHFYHYVEKKKKIHDFSRHLAMQSQLLNIAIKLKVTAIKELLFYDECSGTSFRADVYAVRKKQSFVFEVQCTPIAQKVIRSRSLFYSTQGIQLSWIMFLEVEENMAVVSLKKWQADVFFYNQQSSVISYYKGHYYELYCLCQVTKTQYILARKRLSEKDLYRRSRHRMNKRYFFRDIRANGLFQLRAKRWLANLCKYGIQDMELASLMYKYQIDVQYVSMIRFHLIVCNIFFARELYYIELVFLILILFAKCTNLQVYDYLVEAKLLRQDHCKVSVLHSIAFYRRTLKKNPLQ